MELFYILFNFPVNPIFAEKFRLIFGDLESEPYVLITRLVAV